MRRVTFQSVLHGAARLAGLDPTRDLREPVTSDLCDFINTAVAHGWRWDFWPEWTLTEERTRTGDATDGYQYPSIESGKTTIETVKGVFKRNPKLYVSNPYAVDFTMNDEGIMVRPTDALATLWAQFRAAPPEFAVTVWSAATTYAANDLRYRSNAGANGETYLALQAGTNKDPLTETAYWERVDFPAALADHVKYAAAAEFKRRQGQDERANQLLVMAESKLQEALDRELDSQGQYERAGVVGYGR